MRNNKYVYINLQMLKINFNKRIFDYFYMLKSRVVRICSPRTHYKSYNMHFD